MKDYIKSLIKRDGEQAAGKIAEDFRLFVEHWFTCQLTQEELDEEWEYFQDEVLNK